MVVVAPEKTVEVAIAVIVSAACAVAAAATAAINIENLIMVDVRRVDSEVCLDVLRCCEKEKTLKEEDGGMGYTKWKQGNKDKLQPQQTSGANAGVRGARRHVMGAGVCFPSLPFLDLRFVLWRGL